MPKKKARERKDTEKTLQEQLNNLLAQSEHCKNNPALIKIQTVQSRLKRITEQKVKGAMMRSKARGTEYGEKKYEILS